MRLADTKNFKRAMQGLTLDPDIKRRALMEIAFTFLGTTHKSHIYHEQFFSMSPIELVTVAFLIKDVIGFIAENGLPDCLSPLTTTETLH